MIRAEFQTQIQSHPLAKPFPKTLRATQTTVESTVEYSKDSLVNYDHVCTSVHSVGSFGAQIHTVGGIG